MTVACTCAKEGLLLTKDEFRLQACVAGNSKQSCFLPFYLVNLSLGLLGFITIDSFKRSVNQQVSLESPRNYWEPIWHSAPGGNSPRRSWKKTKTLLPPETLSVEAVDFFSMVAGPSGRSRLIKVVAMAPRLSLSWVIQSKP